MTQYNQTDWVSYYMGGSHEWAVRPIGLGWFSSVSTPVLEILGGFLLYDGKAGTSIAALVLQVLSLLGLGY